MTIVSAYDKRVGIAADHGGYALKEQLSAALKIDGYDVVDFGAHFMDSNDDYPDFVMPMAFKIAQGDLLRGIAICGSGVGACVAANKVPAVRAALISDPYSAHQGVEDDDMNVLCLGGKIMGFALAWELVWIFLNANYKGTDRSRRRLNKISEMKGGF